MPKLAALLLLLCSFCIAGTVGPRIYEQDDFGDPMFAEFTYSISADCNASTISLIVMDENLTPVKGANAYLKYVDFSTPLIANVVTDKDGYGIMRLPGNVKLMRGLFILVVEKKGFRSKEVHFDLSPCLGAPSIPQKPAQKPPPGNASQTNISAPPINNSSQALPAQNLTNATNQSEGGQEPGTQTPPPCLFAPAVALLIFFKQMNG